MLPVALSLAALAAAPIPPECEQPALRDVLPLKQLAQLDGALSVGLDSVATWCFDPGGNWTGGIAPQPGKGKVKPSKDAVPTGDCAKAIASCESSLKAVDKPPLRELATGALADLERPFRTAKYLPKRTGLKDTPNDKADCQGRERSALFAQAQARMDIARLTSQIQSEYSNYKAWLMQESMKCRNDVALAKRNAKDNTRLAVDNTPAAKPAEPAAKPAEPATPTDPAVVAKVDPAKKAEPAPASWVTERETALAKPMKEKWRYLADQTGKQETDRDYTLGFLVSRELRACDCTRVNPAAILRSLEKKEGSTALLEAEDGQNTKCTVCGLDAFAAWKPRAEKQCRQIDQLTDFELDKLSKSDDANGIPPRCFEESRTRRAEAKRVEDEKKKVAEAEAAKAREAAMKVTPLVAPLPTLADAGAGAVAAAVAAKPPLADAGAAVVAVAPTPAPALTALPPPPQPTQPAQGNPNLVTVNGMTYYRPGGSDAGLPAAAVAATPAVATLDGGARVYALPAGNPGLTGPGVPVASATPLDRWVPPEAWAPIPPREDGRMYVRLSMSSACVAEITPGPIQARTGDLLLVPFGATQLAVRSPCGGLAEIYWGKEPKPRFSEVFGRNQAIKFEFKNQ